MNYKTETATHTRNENDFFKRMRASICKHCPACNIARKSPESMIGKVLHHPFHSKNCPMWKAYEEVYHADEKK